MLVKYIALGGTVVVGIFVLVLCVIILIGGYQTPGQQVGNAPVYVYHDEAHRVTCWLFGSQGTTGKAISCLPDSQVTTP